MNRSFENIFEKYNISSETPRKRRRNVKIKSNNFHNNGFPTLSKIPAGNSMSYSVPNNNTTLNFYTSCHINNHSKTKYKIPTRYKRLEIIEVHSKSKSLNCSITERLPLNKNDNKSLINDSGIELPSSAENKQSKDEKISNILKGHNVSQTRTALDSIENNAKKDIDCLEITDDKCLSENRGTAPFERKETNSCIKESSDLRNTERIRLLSSRNGSSELDLLIDLIEQETQVSKKGNSKGNQNGNILNCDESLLVIKPCLKGGCQEMFERSLKDAKAKGNFLKYDKKVGLRTGQLLTVVKIDTFHGLTLATVKSQVLNKNFAVVVAREMALHLQLGNRIEAFFDNTTVPYKLLLNGEYLDVYLEPFKLISH